MAWTAVNNGDTALASHVQQVIDALNGVASAGQAILLTQTNGTDYALTVRNQHAYGRALLVEDKDGTDIGRWNQFGLYSTKVITVGNNGNIATSDDPYHLFYAHYNYTGAYSAGTLGQSMIDAIIAEVTINPSNAYDFGGVTGVARNQSGAGAASMRGVAGQIIRYSGTTAADVEAGEFGVHNGASINSYADVGGSYQAYFGACGLLINSISGNVDGDVANGTGVRNNSAIMIYGGAGWKQGIVYYDTDQTTKLFEVDQGGTMTVRGSVALSGSQQRIIGNFDTATVANRPYFKSSATNGNTTVGVMPSGSNTVAAIRLDGSSNLAATDYGYVQMTGGTAMEIGTNNTGGTNRDIIVAAGATEGVRFRATDGFINFTLGGTALGGGAAPTLGTIGGSGPAAAGQAAWLKVYVGGTARFIPVWS